MKAIVLGSAQDAGVPQIGCQAALCRAVRAGRLPRRYPACLGLVDPGSGCALLVDATPEMPRQIELLPAPAAGSSRERALPVQAILLTHAHIGHVLGLPLLGREAYAASGFPVWATAEMAAFLSANRPFAHLVTRGEIALRELRPEEPCAPFPGLEVLPLAVPHRNEDTDTLAFVFRGPRRSLLYAPDFDRYTDPLLERVHAADVVILDGCFFSPTELGHRDQSQIPHPPIEESLRALRGVRGEVRFTHFNHTNPVLWEESPERRAVLEAGFALAREGLTFDL